MAGQRGLVSPSKRQFMSLSCSDARPEDKASRGCVDVARRGNGVRPARPSAAWYRARVAASRRACLPEARRPAHVLSYPPPSHHIQQVFASFACVCPRPRASPKHVRPRAPRLSATPVTRHVRAPVCLVRYFAIGSARSVRRARARAAQRGVQQRKEGESTESGGMAARLRDIDPPCSYTEERACMYRL